MKKELQELGLWGVTWVTKCNVVRNQLEPNLVQSFPRKVKRLWQKTWITESDRDSSGSCRFEYCSSSPFQWVRLAFRFPEALPQIQNWNPSSNLQQKHTHNHTHTYVYIYIYIELQIYTHNYVPSKAGVPWFSNTAKFCDIICHSGRPETRNVLDVLSLAALQSRDWVVGEMHVGLESKDSEWNSMRAPRAPPTRWCLMCCEIGAQQVS